MKFNAGDKVLLLEDKEIYTIYAVYPNKKVSLCLKGYDDVEQDYLYNFKDITKIPIKNRTFKATFLFNDILGNEHKRTKIIKGDNSKKVFSELNSENGMIEILEFREVEK